jgi:hypothetical protein
MAPAERLREPDLVRSEFVAGSGIIERDTRSKTGPELVRSAIGLVTAICRLIVSAIDVALGPVLTVVSGGAATLEGHEDPPANFGWANEGSP